MQDVQIKLAMIGMAGIAAQWIAWHTNLPAIALLLISGLLMGPVTGYIDPAIDFGEIFRPVVSLAVAIILFEGGLTLNFSEIKETSKAVRRIIIVGGPLTWIMGALAAYYIGGLSWQTAIMLGAILVVTGPTVIMPLLRQARLKPRPASLLRWEAIVNDPIGALFGVIAFETFLVLNNVHQVESLAVHLVGAALMALPGAWFLAKALVWMFVRGWVPEYLKAPLIVAVALAGFSLTNLVLEEAGLMTVTVMGIALANSRIASLAEMRRFKETITILLVSAVFVMLSASLKWEAMAGLGWQGIGFVAALLFVVRPIAITIATTGCGLSWQERALTAWIAPRGIVAVAVSGLFSVSLAKQGVADADQMIAITFAVVAATIALHGFSLPFLAKVLDLKAASRPGILIIGAAAWTTALAAKLMEQKIPVLIADGNWSRLKQARDAGIPTYFGDILSEAAHHHINPKTYTNLIAATDNDSYNALICTDFGPEIGRSHVFQIGDREAAGNRKELHFTLGGRPFTRPGRSHTQWRSAFNKGRIFAATTLTDEFDFEKFMQTRRKKTEIILWLKPDGSAVFPSSNPKATPGEGMTIITFGKPVKREAPQKRDNKNAEKTSDQKTMSKV